MVLRECFFTSTNVSFLKNVLLKVEPLLARQLFYFAQQNSGHFLRGYDLSEHISAPDYHRSLRHSSIQEWASHTKGLASLYILWHGSWLTPPFFGSATYQVGSQLKTPPAGICDEKQLYLLNRGAHPRRVTLIQVLTSAGILVTVPWLITVKPDLTSDVFTCT